MKKSLSKTLMITAFIFLMLMFIQKAYAWGPVTHTVYSSNALETANQDSSIVKIIQANREWFDCGLMFPDVTVIHYYTKFASYQATHAWSFYDALYADAIKRNSPQAQAFAFGVACHLLQDSIVHNGYVPSKIRGTLVQNNIIHPVVESIIEAKLIDESPEAKARAEASFVPYNQEFADAGMYDSTKKRNLTPCEWAFTILGKDFTSEADTFNVILTGGSFYDTGYVIPGGDALWDIYRGFASFLKNIINVEDYEPYKQTTIQRTVDWFNSEQPGNPQMYSGLDPTGWMSLADADSNVVQWTIVIMVLFILFGILIIRWRRGRTQYAT